MAANTQVLLGLYAAIYTRSPEKTGYDYWNAGFTTGTLSNHVAATAFSARPEWTALYPTTLTTAAYVDKVYLNVLGITGDTEGRAYWTNLISNKTLSRTDFVADFISGVLDYDFAKDTSSTSTQKADALTAQTTLKSKVAFSEAWVASPNATDATKTGVTNGTYNAANDQSVKLLSTVKDSATLATQTYTIDHPISSTIPVSTTTHAVTTKPSTDSTLSSIDTSSSSLINNTIDTGINNIVTNFEQHPILNTIGLITNPLGTALSLATTKPSTDSSGTNSSFIGNAIDNAVTDFTTHPIDTTINLIAHPITTLTDWFFQEEQINFCYKNTAP